MLYSPADLAHLDIAELFDEYVRLKMYSTVAVIKNKCQSTDTPCNIEVDDLAPFPLTCPVLGIDIDYFKKGKGGSNHSPSIDRMDPDKGYVKGNVRIISQKANRLKQDASVEEQMQLLCYATGISFDELSALVSSKAKEKAH